VTSELLTTSPAEEAVFMGGSNIVFKFQQPFTITEDDIAAEAAFAAEFVLEALEELD
jgi:hypothetical protein